MSFEALRKPRRKAGLLLIMLKNNSSFLHGCGLIPNLSVTLSAVKDKKTFIGKLCLSYIHAPNVNSFLVSSEIFIHTYKGVEGGTMLSPGFS